MPQVTDRKVFNSGMNKDLDPRFLQSGEYIDAENIIINDSVNSKNGVVANLNSIVSKVSSSNLSLYGAKVIGVFADESNDAIYTFISQTNLNRIVKYDINTDSHQAVVVSNNLPWTVNTIIKSFSYIDGMIFWTDGENEPMMFNENIDYLSILGEDAWNAATSYSSGDEVYYKGIMYKATNVLIGATPSGTLADNGYWDVMVQSHIDEDHFAVAKVVPTNKPGVGVFKDDSSKANNIIGKFFQFKHRFIFKDNMKSSFSPVSVIAYSVDDYTIPEESSGFYNAISVTIPTDGANQFVDKVEIVVRSGNTGDWYSIDKLDASTFLEDGGMTIVFHNNGLYQPIAYEESNQIYSDLPRVAGTQLYANNRLIFGNCKTGYDKDIIISHQIELLHGGAILSSVATWSTNSTGHYLSPVQSKAQMQSFFNDIQFSPKYGDIISFEGDHSVDPGGAFGFLEITVGAGEGIEEIWRKVSATRFMIGWESLYWDDTSSPEDYLGEGHGDARVNDHLTVKITASGAGHQRTLKSGAWYNVGYQYFDKYGRTNGVIYDESNKFYVPTPGERFIIDDPDDIRSPFYRQVVAGDTRGVGATTAMIILNHEPPDWAEYYSIVYNRTKTASMSQYLVVTSPSLVAGKAKLTLESYNDFQDRFPKTSFAYDFVKGDRVRFITAGDGAIAGLTDWADDVYDYEITDFDASGASITIDFYISELTQTEMDNALIEIYRPGVEVEEDESLFYESSKVYSIDNGHGATVKQDLTGTSGSSDSLFWATAYVTNKANGFKFRLSGSSGVPKTYFQDGEAGELTISNVVYDQSDYPIWVAGYNTTVSGRECQYNGILYEWSYISGTTGEPGVDTNWTSLGGIEHTYTMSYMSIIDGDYFFVRTAEMMCVEVYNTLIESADITYETNDKGIILFDDGDAYYRTRSLLSTTPGVYNNRSIESFSVSDFRDSVQANIGRPSAIINQQEEDRYATLMYSQPYIPGTEINNLNNVYPDVNFEEYDRNFGAIIHLDLETDRILMMQEDQISQVLIGRSISYSPDGTQNYLTSENAVLSKAVPYGGDYGIHDHRSFVSDANRKYFVDIKRGVVVRLSQQGVEEISTHGMKGWFANACKEALLNQTTPIVGAYDPLNNLYIIHMFDEERSVVFSEENNRWISFSTLIKPTFGVHLNNRLFIETQQLLFEANDTSSRNQIDLTPSGYAAQSVDSYIEFPCNIEPSTLKNFLAIEIDGTYAPDVDVTIDAINGGIDQESELDRALDFRQKEQVWNAPFLRDSNTPNVSNPLIEGDTLKGMEAKIKLTMTGANKLVDWFIKTVGIVISKG